MVKVIKVIYIVFICILFCSCTCGGKEGQVAESREKEQEVTENMIEENKEVEKYPEVVDETGVSRQLKLGQINIEETGNKLQEIYFTSDYSQIVDGHYYYMRSDVSGNHTVYRDKKEVVTRFVINSGYLYSFFKCGDLFYGLLEEKNGDADGIKYIKKLICINPNTGNTTVLKDMSKDNFNSIQKTLIVYKDFLYYEDWSTLVPDSFTGRLAQLRLNGGLEKKHLPVYSKLEKTFPKPPLTLIDGKLYYVLQEEKKVTLFSFDLDNNTEEEVFCYERKNNDAESEVVLQIDDDYIYCQDYIIPRKGGKMRQILKERDDRIPLSYNDDYIFYIDKDRHLHRIKKNTYKDILLFGQREVEGVDCVGEGIYVRCCNHRVEEIKEEEEDIAEGVAAPYSSCSLFYMDVHGKNRKCLCYETAYKIDWADLWKELR